MVHQHRFCPLIVRGLHRTRHGRLSYFHGFWPTLSDHCVLASTIFENSLLFSLALTLIGLAFIGVGILWQRYEAALSTRLRRGLPVTVQELRAQRP